MVDDEVSIKTVQIIRDLVTDVQIKLISLYKNEHIFIACSDNNDIFHYIKDGSSYILLFKHDYEEYKTSDDKDVRIKKMLSMDNAATMVMLLDDRTLKTFALPDLIYVDDSDKKDVEDAVFIDDNNLMIKENGEIKLHNVIHNKIIEQKWFALKDIKHIGAVRKLGTHKYGMLVVNKDNEVKLLELMMAKKKNFGLKDIETDSKDGEIQLFEQEVLSYFIFTTNSDNLSVVNFLKCGENEVYKSIQFEDKMVMMLVKDHSLEITLENSCKFVNLLTFEVTEDSISSIKNITTIDNNFFLNWKQLEGFEEGKKYLTDFENKYKKVDIYENITHNQSAVDVQREHEKLLLVNNLVVKSKQVIVDESMDLIIPNKLSSLINNFNFESIKLCDLVLNELSKNEDSDLLQIETQYVCYYKLFLIMFHNESIDSDAIEQWIKSSTKNKIDMKVLLYLLGFEVFGDIWIHNGLIKIVEKLKLLKLENKIDDKLQMLKSLLITLLDSDLNSKINDFFHVKKSITFEFVNLLTDIEDFDEVLEVMNYVDYETFADDLITKYESIKSDYILYALYNYKQNYLGCLSILEKNKHYKRLHENLVENLDKIEDSDLFIHYFVVISNNLEEVDDVLMKKMNKLITKDNKNIKVVLSDLNNEQVKYELLDTIKDVDDLDDEMIENIADYCVMKVENYFIKDSVVHEKYVLSLTKYKDDYAIENKMSLKEHLDGMMKKDTLGSEIKKEVLTKFEKKMDLLQSKFDERFHNDLYVNAIFGMDLDTGYFLEMNDFRYLGELIKHDGSLLPKVLSHYKENEIVFIKLLNKYYDGTISLSELLAVVPSGVRIKTMSGLLVKAVGELEHKSESLAMRLKLLQS